MQPTSPNSFIIFLMTAYTAEALVIWTAIFWRSIRRRQCSILSLLVLTTLVAAALALPLALIGWR